MRAGRLLSLLMLLQTRGKLTAEQLAAELEVSVRTIYRDVESLSAAGVPIYADRGPAGGYRLLGGYRTRLTGLTADEAESLFLAGTPDAAAELGLGSVLAAAQLKLMAALPPELRDRAGRVRQRFHLDVPGWFKDIERPHHLDQVAQAVWDQQVLEVRYERWGRVRVTRRLAPYGLVLKAGIWYLVAAALDPGTSASRPGLARPGPAPDPPRPGRDSPQPGHEDRTGHDEASPDLSGPGRDLSGPGRDLSGPGRDRTEPGRDGAAATRDPLPSGHERIRTYRVARIQAVDVSDERFERPADFDLTAYWTRWNQEYARRLYRDRAVVRLSPSAFDLLGFYFGGYVALAARESASPDADGWVTATLPIESVRHATHDLLRMGAEVEVLEPPELRQRIAAEAAKVAERYGAARR